MKTTKFLSAILVLALTFAATSCNDDEPKKNTGNDDKVENPVTEQLDAEAQVAKLNQVAKDLTSTFKTKDQEDVIELFDCLHHQFSDYSFDWNELEDHYAGNPYSSIWQVARYASDVARGKRFATQANNFTFDLEAESAIWEANDDTRTWEYKGKSKDKSVQFIYTFEGRKIVAKLSGQGATKTYKTDIEWEEYDGGYYDDWDNWHDNYTTVEKHYTAVIPDKLIFTLTEGNTEHARVTIHVEATKGQKAECTIEARVANLTWDMSATVNSTNATFDMHYNYGEQQLISLSAALPSYKLLDKNSNETWEEWILRYEDEYDQLLSKVGGVNVSLNLLRQIQIKSEIKKGGKFYDDYANWNDEYPYDDTLWDQQQSYESRVAQMELADIYNNNVTTNIYYSSDIVQSQIKLDVRKYTESYYGYTYYGVIPVLYFPQDDTSYEFAEYFDENDFDNSINLAEKLINQYIRLFKYIDLDEVDF